MLKPIGALRWLHCGYCAVATLPSPISLLSLCVSLVLKQNRPCALLCDDQTVFAGCDEQHSCFVARLKLKQYDDSTNDQHK